MISQFGLIIIELILLFFWFIHIPKIEVSVFRYYLILESLLFLIWYLILLQFRFLSSLSFFHIWLFFPRTLFLAYFSLRQFSSITKYCNLLQLLPSHFAPQFLEKLNKNLENFPPSFSLFGIYQY